MILFYFRQASGSSYVHCKLRACENPVKSLVPIYVFAEMKLRGLVIFKTKYNVLSPNFHIHLSVCDLYIPRIGLFILLQPNRQTDPGKL